MTTSPSAAAVSRPRTPSSTIWRAARMSSIRRLTSSTYWLTPSRWKTKARSLIDTLLSRSRRASSSLRSTRPGERLAAHRLRPSRRPRSARPRRLDSHEPVPEALASDPALASCRAISCTEATNDWWIARSRPSSRHVEELGVGVVDRQLGQGARPVVGGSVGSTPKVIWPRIACGREAQRAEYSRSSWPGSTRAAAPKAPKFLV